jgi:hypothetical protein
VKKVHPTQLLVAYFGKVVGDNLEDCSYLTWLTMKEYLCHKWPRLTMKEYLCHKWPRLTIKEYLPQMTTVNHEGISMPQMTTVPFVTFTIQSFLYSWLIAKFVTRVTWRVPQVEQELLTLQGTRVYLWFVMEVLVP